ncbi:hypothetical protein [Comamonas sp. 26]|uniref:hypothetical protein n=1 Tax=Comamonas sp. 26 TaxID=2035201 RepID=UPI000C18E29C|nr:hypothetical protein [Comamonas sp. 26]PIG08634.1 hypothetical protein CLU84_1499 [Comamonas sp. 26]
MARYMAEQSDSTFLADVLKIALGVFIGSLLAAFVYTKYMAWEMNRALGQVNTALTKETQRMWSETNQSIQRTERATQQRTAAEQIEKDRISEQVRQRQIAQQREAELDARRQVAWERYYQPSAGCKADSSTMACANAFMAAKKRFLEQYQD